MNQLTNYEHNIDFLLNDESLSQSKQTTVKQKMQICNECNRRRKIFDESCQICLICHKAKLIYKPIGNKVIDDFIKYTLISGRKITGKMVFVSYD